MYAIENAWIISRKLHFVVKQTGKMLSRICLSFTSFTNPIRKDKFVVFCIQVYVALDFFKYDSYKISIIPNNFFFLSSKSSKDLSQQLNEVSNTHQSEK